MSARAKATLAACIYVLAIFGLAMVPGTSRTPDDARLSLADVARNLLHLPLYGGLAFMLRRAARAHARILSMSLATGVLLTGVIVGSVDERIQSHTPGRSASMGDLALDFIALFAVVGALWIRDRNSSRQPHEHH